MARPARANLALAAALLVVAAVALAPRPALAGRPLRDPNNPAPKPGSWQAAQLYHAETNMPAGVAQAREQGNYAIAGGATSQDGYAASATGSAVGALWPQAMAAAARTGGGPYSGPYGGYGGGMYGRNGMYYGRDRTNWPNHSAGSMAIAGGQTAAIASTGKATAAAFGGRR